MACERFTSLHFNVAFCQNQQFSTHTYREAAFPRRSGLGTPPKPQSENK